MRVCYINAYYDPGIKSGAELVDKFYTVREFAREQAEMGAEVHVLQLFHRDEAFHMDKVSYWFIPPSPWFSIIGSAFSRLRPSSPPAHYQLATRLTQRLIQLQPDIIHFFGLTLDLNLWIVSRTAQRLGIPIVVQYHGGQPARGRMRKMIQRGNLRRIDRFLFTTMEHARPWYDPIMPLDMARVAPFIETSSTFQWRSREESREETEMHGNPVFLWTGRLHPEKDPLTALRAFERIHSTWPEAQLYLFYLTDELLSELQDFVACRAHLTPHVHFCGTARYELMEAIYNSADYFLQASSRETSGCAVLEAMSCGVIPAVTDIPSFRAMTDDGRYGVLFPLGDDVALAQGVLAHMPKEIPCLSKQVRCRFEQALSFSALAQHLNSLYVELTDSAMMSCESR